jgi:signal transduction histidine kinase
MRLFQREKAVPTALIIPAAVVLIVLAVLQYRWTTQVSEATGVRLADTLQLSMINWHLDFFRNFSDVCLAMRGDPEASRRRDATHYLQRLEEWRAIATYPDLVSNVYLVGVDLTSHPVALRLDRAGGRFDPVPWPPQLDQLRQALERPSSGSERALADRQSVSRQSVEGFYNIGRALQDWQFDPELPALLYPISRKPSGSDAGASSDRDAAEWLVVELSTTVIQTRMLPDLAHRYFQGTDGLDYQVAVIAGSRPRPVIYSSDSGFGEEDVVDADGRMDVFGRTGGGRLESPIYVFHKPSQNKGPTAAVGISWFPLLREMPQDQDWQLVVRHRRGGPLGAFVTAMHRRNLAISFGAILLLVMSMGILIIVSTRAHRLAKLQMDFVTAVSHELRTPLTVISSAADNVAHGVVEGKEQVRQYGVVIANHARQLSALVEQVLLFAATRDGRQRYTLQPLTIAEILDATLAATDGLIQAARFTVERDVDEGLPRVTGDRLAVSQCLQNLITNALKYGRDQRWIGIRASVAERDDGGREVRMSVSDRGSGIDPADIPHIFEPFYRSHSTAAAQIHGTGLGLSLALSIAEAMGGQLTVTSEPGRGSTFTLHLPCLEHPMGETDPVPMAPVSTTAGRIMNT